MNVAKTACSPMQLLFIDYYTDPTKPTFNNASAAAEAAGYSPKSAKYTGLRLKRKAHIQAEIHRRQQVTTEQVEMNRKQYVVALLEQADAWKENGTPKVKMRRYFHKEEELAADAEDAIPGMAQYKALELAGAIMGHLPEDQGGRGEIIWVVGMPAMAADQEEWWKLYGQGLAAAHEESLSSKPTGRAIPAPVNGERGDD